ncbi:DUF3419 family protein [Microbulbifer sp. ZKSA006]|uniref:DUF3419 family protein n=1 Tax=Microbulbifer sp. ZKSA006 TaxID=3243390 RepID=UPI00403A66F6
MNKPNDILLSDYAERISYSGPNEDSRSELKALNINENDSVLCITGGGDRVLSLLLGKPKKITAIDLNPCQNYLLELKIAGIQALNHEEFLSFSGILPCQERQNTYNEIKHLLSKKAELFWAENKAIIEKGFIYEGAFEKHFKLISVIIKAIRPNKIKTLTSLNNIEDQREFVRSQWNTPAWKTFLQFLTNKYFFKFFLKDPGFYQHIPQAISVSEYLLGRMDHSLMNHLVLDNFFMTFLLTGKYNPEQGLPLYLEKNNYPLIKGALDNTTIEMVTSPLEQHLYNSKSKIDKFSISDVSAYLNEESFVSLLDSIYLAGSENSILCMRHFITKREIPDTIRNKFSFNSALEKELNHSDISFVYSFNVGVKCERPFT